ncbi:MAG TPA: FtsX-like permease family protein [Puia sp.]|nr:FtsX-like permease family protein [Puia sp.]
MNYKKIQPLIIPGKNYFSKWLGYVGLCIGILILLVSLQMFINIQRLLHENNPRKNGFDYLSVSKTITNDNMGKDNSFTTGDLAKLKTAPGVDEISPLLSNKFRAEASAGSVMPFSTDLFLESINSSFIDSVPPAFTWQPGQSDVPLIFSSDFLEIYNVFAPAQGLPQLSEKTISSVNIILVCSGPLGTQNYRAGIVAFSDRINSILVPQSFLNWNNLHLTGDTATRIERVYIKTKDANNPRLISYLDQQNYHLNKDKVKFSRIKSILQNIVAALGIFGILVIALALMLFSFYVQLMIARSRDNLRLLLMLGYSPGWLATSVAKTWLPVYLIIIALALIITQLLHLLFRELPFVNKEDISYALHWSVFAIAIALLLITIFINSALVKKELNKLM